MHAVQKCYCKTEHVLCGRVFVTVLMARELKNMLKGYFIVVDHWSAALVCAVWP